MNRSAATLGSFRVPNSGWGSPTPRFEPSAREIVIEMLVLLIVDAHLALAGQEVPGDADAITRRELSGVETCQLGHPFSLGVAAIQRTRGRLP